MTTTIESVRELRARTHVSLQACKAALDEASGDMDVAIEILQKRGELKARDLAGRDASEGRIHTYIHAGGQLAVMLEVDCETDFASQSEPFLEFCEQVAMQVAGANPKWVRAEDIPWATTEAQVKIFEATLEQNKPQDIRDKIIAGKLQKWYEEECLLLQRFVMNDKLNIESLRATLSAKLGENVVIRRFIRWEVGQSLPGQ
jgi:elongation factor Ts